MSMNYSLFRKIPYYVDGEDVGVTTIEETEGFNITHNLGNMADKVIVEFNESGYLGSEKSLYGLLWSPYKEGFRKADAVYIHTLNRLLLELLSNPDKYKKYNPENGWGDYDCLVKFTERILRLCIKHKDWFIQISR